MPEIVCRSCRRLYPPEGAPYRCPKCGGYFDYSGPLAFDPALVEPEQPGMLRFQHALNLFSGAPLVTLGEGNTPLIWQEVNGERVGLKMESLNPTGSYKDRGTAVLVSQLQARGIREALEDSSGNAGASFAAYAARAGIRARVFVPDSASGPKRTQIEMYGADLVRVPGPRSAAAAAVLAEVSQGKVYASHAYMPFGLAGVATIAYELVELIESGPRNDRRTGRAWRIAARHRHGFLGVKACRAHHQAALFRRGAGSGLRSPQSGIYRRAGRHGQSQRRSNDCRRGARQNAFAGRSPAPGNPSGKRRICCHP